MNPPCATDVVVVGAGVSGLSVAHALLERGHRVAVVERGEVGRESSWAGGGILFPLLPWDYPEPVTALTQRALARYPDWIAAIESLSGGSAEYWPCGMTLDTDVPGIALDWCAMHGIAVRPMPSTGPLARLELPSVAQARNPRLIRVLLDAVCALGAKVREHSAVARVSLQDNGVEITLANGDRLHAGQLVLATGAWACAGLPDLPGPANVRPIRGQMLLFKLLAGALDTILYRDGLYLIPRRDGHILAGSTLEDAGFNKATDADTAAHLHARAAALFPPLAGARPIRHWAGLRPGSPGNIPLIGRHPASERVFVNTGHYRYGLTMAPAAAELLTDLMTGQLPMLDPHPYAWAAFARRQWADHP